ncbi:MAG: LysR family transcriptional regulator [Anaeromyxobacter sp. RBG_16_69_14]|nr:MAG: LysR family transcriptional regulator [Anaeromyxobacter sp. RBG_16_69_14]
MEWLNYHHLLYFWVVAKEGSIARATRELRLAQPTISGQIHRLEEVLGEKLFARKGRNLELTEIGRVVFRYAEEIFALGRELQDTLKGAPVGRPLTLVVGVADVVPKLIARRLLEPALKVSEPVHLVCREDKPDRLLAELAVHELDIVLADAPVSPSLRVRAFNHLLGECDVVFLAAPKLAATHRRGFPRSLDGAPLLLPTENTALRRSLDQWFTTHDIRPRVVGEFEDSALLKEFGQTGLGIFPAPSVIVDEVRGQYRVRLVGRLEEVRERFYAISVERKLKHPTVVAISQEAREKIFG